MKPLEGIRVLDLTWVYSGPFCTLMLNDLGAEIIKLEGQLGDYTRWFPPLKNGWSGYFYMLNRGKKSITLNLKIDEGRQVFLDLIKHVDVVTDNFVPGTMDRLGIGYEVAKRINPRIIYASISGFGSNGPYAKVPCVDPIAQAMSGFMSMTGYPGQPPLKAGPAIADAMAGMNLTIAILAAMQMRERTGLGQQVEVAMVDSVFAVLEEALIRYSMTGEKIVGRGNTDPLSAPWDAFPTSDNKWIMVCAIGDDMFKRIFLEIGRQDIIDEFAGNHAEAIEKRSANMDRINAAFAEWSITKTADEVAHFCSSIRLPHGVVKELSELIDDPQMEAREMIIDADHPKLGAVKTFNIPIRFSGAEVGIKSGNAPADPSLGEHNNEVLSRLLGMSQEQIARLKETKVI